MTRSYQTLKGVDDTWCNFRGQFTVLGDPAIYHRSGHINFSHTASTSRIISKDPDWKVRAAKRLDASGSYYKRVINFKPSVTKVSFVHNAYADSRKVSEDSRVVWGFDPLNTSIIPDPTDLALRDLALARLKQKLAGRSNQMNLIIPLVEIRELRQLVVALTFFTTDLVHALIRIKRTKGKSAAQFASHAWLNWSFAVAPTLSEIGQLQDSIADYLQKSGGDVFTDYGAARKEWKSSLTQSTGICTANASTRWELQHKLSYRFVSGYTTPLRSANNYNANIDFGLELGALVPALWELTAFSWLVDYFGTVGAYLEDTFVTDSTTSIYCNCTSKYSVIARALPVLTNLVNRQYANSVSSNGSEIELYVTQRAVFPNLPRRSLRFKTSDEIGKNAINKLLNLGSILVGGKALSNRF